MRKFESKKNLRKQIAELQADVAKYEKSWVQERDALLVKYELSVNKAHTDEVSECPRCKQELYIHRHGWKPRCFTCNYPHMSEAPMAVEEVPNLYGKLEDVHKLGVTQIRKHT